MLVALMCTAFAGQAWADGDIALSSSTVTIDNFSAVGSSYITTANTTKTIGGYTWTVYQCMNLGKYSGTTYNNLQMKASTGTFTSPTITSSNGFKVTVTYSSKAALTLQIGSEDAVTGNTTVANAQAGTGATVTATTTSTSTSFKLSAGNQVTYVSKIEIEPVAAPSSFSVTYNANGATSGSVPTDANTYASGASVIVLGNTGNLAKVGYTFDGWNTAADGSGTDRAVGSTFSITAGTTLYAKWSAKTISTLAYTGTPTTTTYYAGQSFDATGLTVTATYSDDSEENVTSYVTWNPDPLTQGTTSVTGTFLGEEVTVTGLTVTAAPGTLENPYTVAAVTSYITGGGTGNKYTSGIISEVGSTYTSGTNTYLTYYISDDGTTTGQLMIYRGKNLGNTNFSAASDLKVGDRVIVYGPVTYYNSTTPEYTTGNYIYSISRDFTLTLDDMTNGSAAVQVNGVAQVPDGSGNVTVASGATVTLTATPDDGYTFGKWTSIPDDWDNSTENPLVFTMPFDDVMFGATFADAAAKYDIVVDDAVVGGTISADVAEAKAGETVTLTATPDANYVFGSWTVEDESSNAVTVINNQFTMPASDVAVTATFLPIYTVNYYIGGVKNTTTRVSGEELNLDAPSTAFAGWSTANSAASPVFVANDAAVTSNLDVYAVFTSSYSADYRLVEADQADWRGDYLIAYSDDTFADGRVGGTDTGGMGASGVSVNPGANLSGKVVDLSWGDTYNVTIEAVDNSDLSEGYLMKTKDGKYNYQSSNSNGLSATATRATAANYPLSITYNSSSNIDIAISAGAVFHYNASGFFRFYKNGGQENVYLYKRTLTATYSLDVHEAVTVGSAEYTTYVTKNKVSLPSGVKAYIAVSTSASSVSLTEVTKIPADEPIIVNAEAGTYYLPATTDAADDVSSNLLQTSTGSTTGDGSTIFALGVGKSGDNEGKVGFYLVGNGVTIPAGKAYLTVAAGVKEFLTFDFDLPTGIGTVQGEGLTVHGSEIYNLAGQKMSRLQKGVNIMNGKKVLVK